MSITLNDLKPFQKQAAAALATMIQAYPSDRFKPRYDPDTSEELPFLCRLQAITGAGKTPMLALAAQYLRTGIILWTTNRSAIIAQTLANLKPGGKYAPLLPSNTQIYALDDHASLDWTDLVEANDGLTILLATVGSFNQDGDKLKIRKSGRWDVLAGKTKPRARPLYVFYDEGHGATEKQFNKLIELRPRALVLASASPLPADLARLLSGKTPQEHARSLADRTVIVSTKDVGTAGLLKSRLYLMECNTAQADAIREATTKWQELFVKLAPLNQIPIACFVVSSTLRGVEVWETLVQLGIDKTRIAVHLKGAEDVMTDLHGMSVGLIDTHKAQLTPDELRAGGYTHIIWNLSLREGWDEPLAYVGYFDDAGKSTTDRVQKIGRFVRQPNATLYDDPDLNAAYFYFNVADEEFNQLVTQIQSEMEIDGYEIMAPKKGSDAPTSRCSPVMRAMEIPTIVAGFGDDINVLDSILLSQVPSFADDDLVARGSVQTRVVDMRTLKEDPDRRGLESRVGREVITPWEYLKTRLMAIDSRIIGETGTRFSLSLREHRKMQQPMQFGSSAMQTLNDHIPTICQRLNNEFRLYSKGVKYGRYVVPSFNLVSPDLVSANTVTQERYKVRSYTHAVHAEYNGLNPFEVVVADALDLLELLWCRNPSNTGYGIPITELGTGTNTFYPDFLLQTEKAVWALDPKGQHLAQEAVTRKLIDMVDIEGLSLPIRVALILQGTYNLNTDKSPKPTPDYKTGFTLIRRMSGMVRVTHNESVLSLLRQLTTNL